MPSTSIFPERRTRSQLTLPDTVLAIPEKSPLKIAKSRNTMTPRDKDTVVEDSEGEDELMLSPSIRKKTPPTGAEASKRSASQSRGDEYALGSSDGRDLKRRKRDVGDEGGMGKDVDVNTEVPGLVTPEAEPRRSASKRFTPSNRKPVSTVSASPTPTTRNSPAPVNGRAQSVPLFASAEDLSRTDLPRLDFTKLIRSPKRKRSRSRSPVKDTEPKLRITTANAAIPFRLPTIHAGIATGSGSHSRSLSDGESSVPEEREMEIPAVPPRSSSPAPALSGGDDDASSSPPVPATPVAVISTMALDKTMPMSPLTPVPPTPFPPIRKPAAYIKSRLAMQIDEDDADSDAEPQPMKDLASGVASSSGTQAQGPSSTAAAIASSSRPPASQSRPSMAPPTAVPSKPNGRPSGQPPPVTNKKSTVTHGPGPLASSSSMPSLATFNPLTSLKPKLKPKDKPNAFEMLMAGSNRKGKGKAGALPPSFSFPPSSSSSSGVGPSFAPVVAKPSVDNNNNANGMATGAKLKLKDRMRKKQKEQVEKAPVIAALPEEEEEEERQILEEAREKEKEARNQEEEDDEKEEQEKEADQEAEPAAGAPTPDERPASLTVQEPEQGRHEPQGDEPLVIAAALSFDERVSEVAEDAQDVVMEELRQEPQEPLVDTGTTSAMSESVLDDGGANPDVPRLEQGDMVGNGMERAPVPGPVMAMEESTAANLIMEATSGEQPDAPTPLEVATGAQMDVEESRTDHVEDDAVIGRPTLEAGAGADESHPVADAEVAGEEEEVAEDQDLEAPPTKQSKTALGKKRQPATAIPLPTRVTRSSSTRKQGADVAQPAAAGPSRKQPKLSLKAPLKRTASGKVKLPEASSSTSIRPTEDNDSKADRPQRPRTPGSPMKISTPKKAAPVLTKGGEKYTGGAHSTSNTPVAKRVRGSPSPRRPASSPSPMKASRVLPEYTPIRPTAGITRTFSASQIFTRPGSSLSQLSNALQKLHQPAPARPSTSMGFNLDGGDETDNDNDILTTKDDAAIGQRKSIGLVRVGSSASQRSVTLGSDAFKSAASSSSTTTATAMSSTTAASSSLARPTASSQAKLVQKKLAFGSNKTATGPPRFGTGAAMRGRPVGGGGVSKVRPLFGVGGGLRRTASKKSSLPVVIGSPVKGGSSSNAMAEEEEQEEEDAGGEIFNTILNTGGSATTLLTNLLAQQPEKGKDSERGAHKPPSHSRRVSMLSRDLLVAATAPPPPPPSSSDASGGASGSGSGGKGLMGPPPTPPSVASVKSTSDSGSPSTGAAKRSSARIAKTTAAAAVESSIAAGKKRAMDPPPVPNPAAEALQVLNECVIFVDVKTDEGDEAGTLFVDMLGTLGARVAAGVGQRCTHIVFKNGLSSTTNKYRALRDPKPHVVSIGWVVACAEQRKRVPEAEYLVDLEFANILGANKRRRASAFHKLLTDPTPDYSADRDKEDAAEEGDRSMDGSVSSITMEDDGLAPLERARRRKSMMIGLNH
ncbi:hypothetical protein D9619_001948 [Psilocybe cf. subviscida]|uniref:BRCT domain-containing protein n=1 Tax=Psilocybe cf. subviscida TaxID=2480587 RepID=A0A8H5BCM5_9AGAR|nr:hypothetical protein D9619_001948 [Psilocybe cf. subviscida]